jgi:3-oxoacyl-(acyl-carrier-protein) synthase
MTKFSLFLIAAIVGFNTLANAEIYKTVDSEGRVTYSNVKIKGGKKLDIEPADTSFGGSNEGASRPTANVKKPTPASFPKVDDQTQNQRDGKRKEILQAELDAEKEALAKAKQAHTDGANNPEVYKNAQGQTFRNVAKYQEKMKTLQQDVDTHQRNVDLLNRELGL